MKSCMSLKTFESLKLKLTEDRCPFVVTVTGTSMEPIGFTQCSFNILLILMVIHSHKISLFVVTKHDLSFLGRTSHPGTVLVLCGQNKVLGK